MPIALCLTQTTGSAVSAAKAILEVALEGSGLRMQIVDNQDMTISVWVFPEEDISQVSLELLSAIRQLKLREYGQGTFKRLLF